MQAIFADDYRGATVVFRGDIRTERLTQQAGLRLEILRHWWRVGRAREDHAVTVSGGRHQWTSCEITTLNALANLAGRGALNVRELSAETGTRATTLTGVLDRLENRGYLTRELDPTDRRSFRLPLTEAGQEVAERIRAAVADLERDALAKLSATQIAGFHAVVTALQEAS